MVKLTTVIEDSGDADADADDERNNEYDDDNVNSTVWEIY